MAGGLTCQRLLVLLLAWGAVALYIRFGGNTLREMELDHERKQARDYCVKLDMLMSGKAKPVRAGDRAGSGGPGCCAGRD